MIDTWCRDLMSLNEKTWSAYALSREPLRGKLSLSAYFKYYEKAAACGKEEAELLCKKWGSKDCRVLAGKLGIKVTGLPMPDGAGLITFACYYEPDQIEIYEDNIHALYSILEAEKLLEFFKNVDLYEILLAHELFHVLQTMKDDLYVNKQHIQLWKIGPFCRNSRLLSLEEVAAMHFAETLTGISFSPYILDVLMLLPQAPEQAQKLYQKLMEMRNLENN